MSGVIGIAYLLADGRGRLLGIKQKAGEFVCGTIDRRTDSSRNEKLKP